MTSCNPDNYYTLKRQTTFNSLRFTLPYDISNKLVRIDFRDASTNALILSLSSDDTEGSYILKDSANSLMPIISAEDTESFLENSLYKFDIALVEGIEIKRLPTIYTIRALPFVTDVL